MGVWIDRWEYQKPSCKPDKDGNIVLIMQRCFGPLEWWAWGIDRNGKFYEQYEWCEDDWFADSSYIEEISKEKLLERIKYMQGLFAEQKEYDYVKLYKQMEQYICTNKLPGVAESLWE